MICSLSLLLSIVANAEVSSEHPLAAGNLFLLYSLIHYLFIIYEKKKILDKKLIFIL